MQIGPRVPMNMPSPRPAMPGGMPGAAPMAGSVPPQPLNPAALAGLLQKIRGTPTPPAGMAPGAPC